MLKKLKFWIWIIVIIILVAAGYLLVHRNAADNDSDNVVTTALVSVAPAKTAPFSPTISAYGTLSLSAADSNTLSIQGTGVITSIAVAPYTSVKKGDKLIEISATPDIEATLKNARDNLKHQLALRSQYLATNADVQAARATLISLKTQYGNGKKWIVAASDGVVGAILVTPGQVVSGGSALMNFSKVTQIGASLGIPASQQSAVAVGDAVTITLVNNPAITLQGTVSSVASQLDDQTGLIDVQVTLENTNPQQLIVNTPVQASIATAAPVQRILIPRTAVLYQGNQAYVFVDQKNKAVRRTVVVAGETNQSVAISQGITAGESIVTTGNYELQDGMPLSTASAS